MMNVAFNYHYAECHYAECRCAECRYAECCYAECRYAESCCAECRYAECRYAECRYADCRSDKTPFFYRRPSPTVIQKNCTFQIFKKISRLPRFESMGAMLRSLTSHCTRGTDLWPHWQHFITYE